MYIMEVLSVEEIAQCRSGPDNDIDLQAVYGGRLSLKEEKGLKLNPLYDDISQADPHPDINGNMSPVHILAYETFPIPHQPELLKPKNGEIVQNGGLTGHMEVNFDTERKIKSGEDDHNKNSGIGNGVLIENENRVSKQRRDFRNSRSSGKNNSIDGGFQSADLPNPVARLSDNVNDLYALPMKRKTEYTKGYLTNYGLLGYNNEGFVDDNLNVEHSDLANEIKKPDINEKNGGTVVNVTECLDLNDTHEKVISDYEEIGDVVRDLRPEENYASDIGDSPKIGPTEIVTEVLIHKTDVSDSPLKVGGMNNTSSPQCHIIGDNDQNLGNKSKVNSKGDMNDWPDIDELARPYLETNAFAQNEEIKNERVEYTRSVSDVVIEMDNDSKNNPENEAVEMREKLETSSLYKKNIKKRRSSEKSNINEASSSTRTLKSILTNNGSVSHHSCSSECEHKCQNSDSEIQEYKSVKFSEDTVFNENKSYKFKKERFDRINLRELYRGKIASDSAMAKINPLYQPDDDDVAPGEEGEEGRGKLHYQLTLKHANKLSKGESDSLNAPSYMEQYLILKAHGLSKQNFDIEKLPQSIDRPTYDHLIERTLAKERRKICIRWTMVVLTVVVITAVATTLGVYFKEGF